MGPLDTSKLPGLCKGSKEQPLDGKIFCAPKPTWIRVVCAWCGKFLRYIPGHGQTGVSHGICPKCASEQTVYGGDR